MPKREPFDFAFEALIDSYADELKDGAEYRNIIYLDGTRYTVRLYIDTASYPHPYPEDND